MMAEKDANTGSTGYSPGLISFPYLPIIIAEWAALLPLALHLASYQDDYITTGKISLLGRLPMSLFPALATFSGFARLLENGSDYLDYASTQDRSSRKTWDLKWGNVWPVANGAASATILSYVLKKRKSPLTRIELPATNIQKPARLDTQRKFYRPQILNVYEFKETKDQTHSLLTRALKEPRVLVAFHVLQVVGLMGISAFLGIFGTFGSAIIVLLCAISNLIGLMTPIQRPEKYLQTNESHDACMLVAAHENATEWHLCTGHLGIVDTLLNKPAIVLLEGKWAYIAAKWFRCAHAFQLMAMTFVAAQKGWDGVCLVILLAIHYILSWFSRLDRLAKGWLEKEGIEVRVESFEFHGRSDLIYTIQLFSGTDIDCWINDIMVPHPRRDFSLQMLRLPEDQLKKLHFPKEFDPHDQEKMMRNIETAKYGAQVIGCKLGQSKATFNYSSP